jgi:hypothetical protein
MSNNCCARYLEKFKSNENLIHTKNQKFRLSKVYMITTNSLFACLGLAFIAFGLIGVQDKFAGATLFPDNTFECKFFGFV